MEQNELIMQAARLINEASTEYIFEHPGAANAKLADVLELLTIELVGARGPEPANPEDAPQT